MNQDQAAGFWNTVQAHADVLRAPAHLSPETVEWGEAVEAAIDKLEAIDSAARVYDERLSVEINQVPTGEGSTVLLAISCGCDPECMDAARTLVEAAPALPPGLSACAFKPPVPREVAESQGPMDLAGTQVDVTAVRYLAKPSEAEPGAFDIACFVPSGAVTDMDGRCRHGLGPGRAARSVARFATSARPDGLGIARQRASAVARIKE